MFKTGSPLLRKIIGEETAKARRESQRDDIITFLAARFGPEAEALRADLKRSATLGSRSSLHWPPPARTSLPSASRSGRGGASGGAEAMLKGASRGLLKVVEREMHEAGARAMRRAGPTRSTTVPEILAARFGEEVLEMATAAVTFTDDDRLAEIILLAAACRDFG